MQGNVKILFLYAHVQPFLLAGIDKLVANFNAEVMVVSWQQDKMSPTDSEDRPSVQYVTKYADNKDAVRSRIVDFAPDIVYNVGWMDRDYMTWCKELKTEGKETIMAMDNQWKGTFKQRVLCLLAPFILQPLFNYAWVPGKRQYDYAKRLGFKDEKILNKLYIPDTTKFRAAYEVYEKGKRSAYPKSFLYVGRLVPNKIENLLKAFTRLKDEERLGWKLIVVGNGPLKDSDEMRNEAIIHHPFLQQDKLVELVKDAGVFCLTSREEPWGMVIQEFAAAGMPLLVSKQCGASDEFVRDDENGFVCDGNSIEGIKAALMRMIEKSDNELTEMGKRSYMLNAEQTPELWANTLMSVIKY